MLRNTARATLSCMRRWLLAVLLAAACHHDAPPATPAAGDVPPLPPASGTPIGYLIDDATELHLTSDQLGRLRSIDQDLAGELDALDARQREASHASAGSGSGDADGDTPRRGGHGRHGGMGGMGGGGMSSGGGGHGGYGHRGGSDDHPRASSAADQSRLADERVGDVRDALRRAFDVLAADQRPTAQKVLAAHDVDLDAEGGSSDGAPSSDGSGTAPEATDQGQ